MRLLQTARILSLLFSGLIAGTFFYGTFCVLPTFYEMPSYIHLQFRTTLMNHNKITVMALVLLAILANILYCFAVRKKSILFGFCLIALILTTISLLITRFGSVPINIEMKTWNAAAPPVNWLMILAKWDIYNEIRTVTSIGSFICLLLGDLFLFKTAKSDQL